MLFEELAVKGVYLITLDLHEDERGFFSRQFCEKTFQEAGLCSYFPQCNLSYNVRRGTLRGMHYQCWPHEETKVVSCMKGAIFDVALDLRHGSSSYGNWVSVELSEYNHQMLYIPNGVAHGFQSLEDDTMVYYQMSECYYPELAHTVFYDDERYRISWPIEDKIVSEKDRAARG